MSVVENQVEVAGTGTLAQMPAAEAGGIERSAAQNVAAGPRQDQAATSLPAEDYNPPTRVAGPDKTLGLSPIQVRVIVEMVEGRTLGEAAHLAGVGRTTVYRWHKSDPVFIAALNCWKKQNRMEVEMEMSGMVGKSLKILRQRVDEGSLSAAMAVLRYTRALGGGSPEVEVVAENLQYRRKRVAARVFKMRALPEPAPKKAPEPPETPAERKAARAQIGAIMAALLSGNREPKP